MIPVMPLRPTTPPRTSLRVSHRPYQCLARGHLTMGSGARSWHQPALPSPWRKAARLFQSGIDSVAGLCCKGRVPHPARESAMGRGCVKNADTSNFSAIIFCTYVTLPVGADTLSMNQGQGRRFFYGTCPTASCYTAWVVSSRPPSRSMKVCFSPLFTPKRPDRSRPVADCCGRAWSSAIVRPYLG